MKTINSHIGAWSPMAEQHATAKYLLKAQSVDNYLSQFKAELAERLIKIYEGIKRMLVKLKEALEKLY